MPECKHIFHRAHLAQAHGHLLGKHLQRSRERVAEEEVRRQGARASLLWRISSCTLCSLTQCMHMQPYVLPLRLWSRVDRYPTHMPQESFDAGGRGQAAGVLHVLSTSTLRDEGAQVDDITCRHIHPLSLTLRGQIEDLVERWVVVSLPDVKEHADSDDAADAGEVAVGDGRVGHVVHNVKLQGRLPACRVMREAERRVEHVRMRKLSSILVEGTMGLHMARSRGERGGGRNMGQGSPMNMCSDPVWKWNWTGLARKEEVSSAGCLYSTSRTFESVWLAKGTMTDGIQVLYRALTMLTWMACPLLRTLTSDPLETMGG
jgi:hypothetical protein